MSVWNWTLTVDIATAFAVAIGFYFTHRQIKTLEKTLENEEKRIRKDDLRLILELEAQLYQRRKAIEDMAVEASNKEDELRLNSATEAYLNALDRLCFAILNNYLDSDIWKRDYYDLLTNTIRDEKMSNFFRTATPYKNIVDLREKWSKQ